MTRFTLQITDQLNTWLTEQAALNHRSKNKQIEHLLDMALRQAQDATRRTPINHHSLIEEKWTTLRQSSGEPMPKKVETRP